MRNRTDILQPEDQVFAERYDQEDDIYYVTFKTGEPSCAIEHDDRLLVEVGVFTGRMTGFRIFNFSKHKSAAEGFTAVLKKAFREALKEVAKIEKLKSEEGQARESRLTQFLEKVGA